MPANVISQPDLHATLRAEIEAARDAFSDLVNGLPEAGWTSRAPGSNWTGKQILHHVTWALEQLPKEIESAKRDRGMFNYPKFIADPGSYWLVRWEARKQTRESIHARYNAAIDRAIASLETVSDAHWQRGARFYGEGFYTVENLFRTPTQHLAEHSGPLLAR